MYPSLSSYSTECKLHTSFIYFPGIPWSTTSLLLHAHELAVDTFTLTAQSVHSSEPSEPAERVGGQRALFHGIVVALLELRCPRGSGSPWWRQQRRMNGTRKLRKCWEFHLNGFVLHLLYGSHHRHRFSVTTHSRPSTYYRTAFTTIHSPRCGCRRPREVAAAAATRETAPETRYMNYSLTVGTSLRLLLLLPLPLYSNTGSGNDPAFLLSSFYRTKTGKEGKKEEWSPIVVEIIRKLITPSNKFN